MTKNKSNKSGYQRLQTFASWLRSHALGPVLAMAVVLLISTSYHVVRYGPWSTIAATGYPAVRVATLRVDTVQQQLSYQLLNNEISLEGAITNYVKTPTTVHWHAVTTANQRLQTLLNRIGPVFGLRAARAANAFRIMTYYLIMHLKGNASVFVNNYWDSVFMAYYMHLDNVITSAITDFQQQAYQRLLHPLMVSKPSLNSHVLVTLTAAVHRQAKLLPSIKQDLFRLPSPGQKDCLDYVWQTLGKQGQHAATRLSFLQYYSRACAGFVEKPSLNFCYGPMHPMRYEKTDPDRVAMCHLAQQRLTSEATLATQRYGHLTFVQYYRQFVRPLLPAAVHRLLEHARNNLASPLCDRNQLPVVNFRDPTTDARVAAFMLVGNAVCHDNYPDPSSDGGADANPTSFLYDSSINKMMARYHSSHAKHRQNP